MLRPPPAQSLSGMAGVVTSTGFSCFNCFYFGVIVVVVLPSTCRELHFSLQIYRVDLSHVHLRHASSAKFFHLSKINKSAQVCASSLSCVQLFVTLWTVARQVSLSMELYRQEQWRGLPFPSLRDILT